MPVPKRYFHCSQDIIDDPEMWEFTDEFGDRSLRTWLKILIYLDKSANQWRLSGDWVAVLSRSVRQSSANVRRQIGWLTAKGWLEVGEQAADGSPLVLRAPNWLKYNRTREHKRNGTNPEQGAVDAPLLSFPSPSPSHTPKKKEEETDRVSMKRSPPPLPDSDWLEELQRQEAYQHLNVRVVFQKCENWCLANRKVCSRKRFINWLNQEPAPMQVQGKQATNRPTKVVL